MQKLKLILINIGKIKIVPQDIGRVLFNLYNNAFYAVHEKPGAIGRRGVKIDSKPATVWVTTSKIPLRGIGGRFDLCKR